MSSSRSRSPPPWRMPSASSPWRAGPGASSSSATSCATTRAGSRFIAEARALGPPFVMRMNLNQQSSGAAWAIHRRLMESTSPVVDCGVHYLDVMLQITDSPPVQVRGMGVRLSDEIAAGQVNYGHLQVLFADGSVGWYEAGWGPMISETAFFVKDVMGPRGAVSIVMDEGAASADVETHTKTARIRIHRAETGPDGAFAAPDALVSMADEPGHDALCAREQALHARRDPRGSRSRPPHGRCRALARRGAGGRPLHARKPRDRPVRTAGMGCAWTSRPRHPQELRRRPT